MDTIGVKRVDSYLGSNAIRAMSSSLSLAATVLRFQIVELWHENQLGEYRCTYVHSGEETIRQYSEIIVGYYPEHRREHLISPRLCALSKSSSTRCYWHTLEPSTEAKQLYDIAGFPVLTEMGYAVEGRPEGPNVFIVGFASEILEKKQSLLRFLFGLGYAISIAAFDFEDDYDDDEGRDQFGDELDVKKFIPARPLVATPFSSVVSLNMLSGALSANPSSTHIVQLPTIDEAGLGVWGKLLSEVNVPAHVSTPPSELVPSAENDTIGLDICDSPNNSCHNEIAPISIVATTTAAAITLGSSQTIHAEIAEIAMVPALNLSSISCPIMDSFTNQNTSLIETALPSHNSVGSHDCATMGPLSDQSLSAQDRVSIHRMEGSGIMDQVKTPTSARTEESKCGLESSRHSTVSTIFTSLPPTWDPAAPFSFPVASLPVKHVLPDDLTIDSFIDVNHIADGSNANIFSAKYNGQRVVIKMIKVSVQSDPVSVHEFDVEHGLLCRISHPNIIKILGAGVLPRRFIVLEHLGGGTLNKILSENVSKSGLASRLFRKPSFTYNNLLIKARDIASALNYIHSLVHPGACIIHRDLKPDNIGFSSEGVVKLFDFGLATCVNSRTVDSETYEMTGMTGSLRYMAPETALRKPYTEKVDVYSYGILIWQMARDKVPFKGLNKEEFLNSVSVGGGRPKLDSSWPTAFSDLLIRCWQQDPRQRPPFSTIVEELDKMIRGNVTSTPGKNRQARSSLLKG